MGPDRTSDELSCLLDKPWRTWPERGAAGTRQAAGAQYTDAMGRWARVGSAVGATVALAAAAAYLGVTQTYALEHGSLFSWGNATLDHERSTAVYPLRPGERVEVAISVRNPGSVSITLDGVSLQTLDLAVEDVAVIANSSSNPNCCLRQHAEPFHAVEIDAGDEANVWLTLRQTGANPYAPCTWFTVTNVEVAYNVLGLHRAQQIALPFGLSFLAACDEQKS